MAKTKVKYICNSCGSVTSAWAGKCYQCNEWNSLIEQVELTNPKSLSVGSTLETHSLKKLAQKDTEKRVICGLGEVDKVLGGGLVRGSVNLITGQPGIGKSTILLQLADKVSAKLPVLYVSGEESTHQIGLRAKRLGVSNSKAEITSSNNADDVAATINDNSYGLVIIDSIQTLSTSGIGSSAGTVSQITGCTRLLSAAAKTTNTILILVGHVTKEGSIAGPKILEHIVDVVLQLEGDRYGGLKLLRGIKNRYGATNETGIFEMQNIGLMPVSNPSAALLEERQASDGSIVLATMEGSRPLLVEIQALVGNTSFGYPKRTASGFDLNRLGLLVAMLERRTSLNLGQADIYLNVVGGLKISEPAADLAVCMAVASAAKGLKLKKDAVVFGEVGLSGEIRQVSHADKRLAEANKLGFKQVIGPLVSKKYTGYFEVNNIKTALNKFLEKN